MHTQPIRRTIYALALCALVCAANAAVHSAEDDPAALLEQLRGDDFDARQAAATKLHGMGEAARAVLEKAAASGDAELRQTAAKLLAGLRKAVLRLIAYDRDGNPAAGAEADVKVSEGAARGQNDEAPRSITLDKSGRADLVVAPGGPWTANPIWKLWQNGSHQPNTWQLSLADGINPIVFTLQHGGVLNVQVTDLDSKPVKNAQVTLHTGMRFDAELLDEQLLRWGSNPQFSSNADDKGVATIENVAEGVYQAVVRAEGYASFVLPPQRIREGLSTEASAVLLQSAAGKIQLVVLQADGSPVKSKQVDFVLEPIFEGPRATEMRHSMTVLRQWGGRNRQQNPSTDDAGKVLLENVAPGKYDLYFRSDGKTPQHVGPLTVASGQTLDLGELKYAPGGSIGGKLTGGDEKAPQWLQVSAIPEQQVLDSIQDFAANDYRYMRGDQLTVGHTNSQNKGSWEIKDLLPGRYVVVLSGQYGVLAFIFGMEVAAEKATAAPDVALPKAGETREIKGHITLPDGKPAAGAQVFVAFTNQNGWSAGCDNEGVFRFQAGAMQGDPVSINVRCAGFKHKLVDLALFASKLDKVDVQLEKLGHGAVHVKVVDEDGKPLPGASISPAAGDALRRKTNKSGEADLAGLAAGTRTLIADLDGYYVQDSKVTVEADAETQATVHMHSGFVLKGRVELPADVAKNGVSVALNGAPTRYAPLSNDGTFTFRGVLPGNYTAVALGPGLLTREPAAFVLKAGTTDIPELKLELVRASGIALNLGKSFEGYTASFQTGSAPGDTQGLLLPAFFKNGMSRNSSAAGGRQLSGVVDAEGRLEAWGAAPGAYDLHLLAPTRMYNYYGRSIKTAAITRIVRNIQVPALKSVKDLSTVQPVEVKVEPGTASIAGIVRADASAPNGAGGNLNLTVQGPGAQAALSFGFPHEVRAAGSKPALLGEIPAGLKTPEPGQFSVKGLPPGEYTVTAELSMYRTRTVRHPQGMMISSTTVDSSEKHEPQVLKTFTIKAGETLDLGTLNFTPPKETLEAKAADEVEGEDQTPSFQP